MHFFESHSVIIYRSVCDEETLQTKIKEGTRRIEENVEVEDAVCA